MLWISATPMPARYSAIDVNHGGLWDTSQMGAENWAIGHAQVDDRHPAIERAQQLGATVVVPLRTTGRSNSPTSLIPRGTDSGSGSAKTPSDEPAGNRPAADFLTPPAGDARTGRNRRASPDGDPVLGRRSVLPRTGFGPAFGDAGSHSAATRGLAGVGSSTGGQPVGQPCGGVPISHSCPKGSMIRPTRQPCSSETADASTAPAATARRHRVRVVDDQERAPSGAADRGRCEPWRSRPGAGDPKHRAVDGELRDVSSPSPTWRRTVAPNAAR